MMIYSKNINQAFFKFLRPIIVRIWQNKISSIPKEVISTEESIIIWWFFLKFSFGRKLQYTRNNCLNLESLVHVFRNYCGFMLHCLSELNSNLQYLVYFQNRLRSYFVLGTLTIPGSNEKDPVSVCLFKLKDINCFNSFIWRFDFSISHGQIIYRLVKSIFFSITLSLKISFWWIIHYLSIPKITADKVNFYDINTS